MANSESLEAIAQRIYKLAMRKDKRLARRPDSQEWKTMFAEGPVLTVARDDLDGTISVGFNTGVPAEVADVLKSAIAAQGDRIKLGQVIVQRTDDMAKEGGHSEVCACNPLILRREKILKHKLTETDLRHFEIHNLWVKGSRGGTAAARCEHCRRILRGVSVTQSLFIAEGQAKLVDGAGNVIPHRGVVRRAGSKQPIPGGTASGSIEAPQRGSVMRGGTTQNVTTASGSIGSTVAPRGLVTRTGASKPEHVTSANGSVSVAQRGSVTPAGASQSKPVTTANGSTSSPQRGSVTRTGASQPEHVTTAEGSIGPPTFRTGGGGMGDAHLDGAVVGSIGAGIMDASAIQFFRV